MTRTVLLAMVVVFALSVAIARATTYAEVMAGFVSPTGMTTYRDTEANRVSTNSFGTSLTLAGLFDVNNRLALAPSYSYLSTSGSASGIQHPGQHSPYDIKFQQNELALDLMWSPLAAPRFRFGPGVSACWWFAAESIDNPILGYYKDSRVTRGQSYLLRGVAHLMLRSPGVTGFSMKFVATVPLTNALRLSNSAATGYVGVNIGFSMVIL